MERYTGEFDLVDDFKAEQPTGGLGLGVLETQYEELFAEALEDGVITEDERERLEKAAHNLGLDQARLARLEEAMTASFETHHRVRVVDQSRSPQSLAIAPPLSVPAKDAGAAGPEELSALRQENAALRRQISDLSAELERAQAAINIEIDLGELEEAASSVKSPAEAWKRVRRDPLNVEAHQELYEAYDAAGNADGKALVAQSLEELGGANPLQRELATTTQQRGLIAPQRALDQVLWSDCLIHPEQESLTGAIFSVVAPAILIGRVTTLRRDGQLPRLPEEARQNPSTSTIMAVRALPWASALLGLAEPPMFVIQEEPGGYVHVPAVPPVTLIGAGALSGRSTTELAFLAGRHLSGLRSEHFVRTLFSNVCDLEDLFLAAVLIANPKLPLRSSVRARSEPLARAIEPLLEPAHHDALRGHYLRFAEEGGRTNLQRWGAAVELTAARVGLALSQDLGAALRMMTELEGPKGPTSQDLLAFWTSERFLRLRRALGIAVA